MSGHDHHEHSGAGLVVAAQSALTQAGEHWTEMRADVFAALSSHGKPTSAYDIAESVTALRGKRVAANSVYRILDLFVRTNLARVHARLEFLKLINWKVAAAGGANPADASATKVFATEFYTEAYRLLMEVRQSKQEQKIQQHKSSKKVGHKLIDHLDEKTRETLLRKFIYKK